MKKTLAFLLSCAFAFAFSQEDVYFGKKPSVAAELIMENGDEKPVTFKIFKIRGMYMQICCF